MKRAPVLVLLLFFFGILQAQEPFVCKGNFYISLSPSGFSTLYEFEIDPSTDNVVLSPLPSGPLSFTLNSIGYRNVDNYIYGIQTETLNLYRIAADGSAELLTTLSNIDTRWNYPAGDVTPDGRYLVILGGTGGFIESGTSEALVFIDLESPDYTTTTIDMPPNNVNCFDIAFDPTDGTLYGFDSSNSRLVSINPENGDINTSFPPNGNVLAMGSLFFDAFGNLYGYGGAGLFTGQNIFYRLNKETGIVSIATTGPEVERTDACSCPYTIQLQKTVYPEIAVPCTEVTYAFEFANSSGRVQEDLAFRDNFPANFTITGIENPFGGTISSGIGTNTLLIENMTVPLGKNFIRVTVEIGENALGVYQNQARLEGLPEALGLVAVSDNPATLIQNDSTPITIVPLDVDFSNIDLEICSGDEILLSPSISGVSYEWSTGATDSTFTINQGGSYSVTVSSGCDQDIELFEVEEHLLELDLPETHEIELGDSIQLNPVIIGDMPFEYNWLDEPSNISCTNCPDPLVRPFFDEVYTLSVLDSNGCQVVDSTLISVIKDRKVYLPNAFSPNDDGINDWFYPQSRMPEQILQFRIFSRWGELLFEAEDMESNQQEMGWDGYFNGKPMATGVYVYWLKLEYLDGLTLDFSGDVMLIR
jgi:gliding motility-associated-like protein